MPAKKVMICDDNPAIPMSLEGYLEAENLKCIWAKSGEEALELLKKEEIGLIILDIMLPGINGIETCIEIRRKYNIPILMLSAKNEEIDRIVGLEVGAEDYVSKPFSPKEVAIRARKLFLRYGGVQQEQERVREVGNLKIYPERFEVFINECQLQLTPKEYKLLHYLAENYRIVKSRDEIINEVWGTEYEGESRVVDILVTRLRKKLMEGCKTASTVNIVTVFGFGYKLEEENEAILKK